MTRYKITISYDGTGFAGWMKQPDEPTIMQALEQAFARVFATSIQILGASKTDAGVHARGQVAIFSTDLSLDPSTLMWAWNKALPSSIKINSIEQDGQFHPHYRVIKKIYQYYVSREKPSPFFARSCWHYLLPFDADLLKQALACFVGTHDFRNFYKGDDREDSVRTVHTADLAWLEDKQAYCITIVGEKFLRHMVRRIVGASLHVAAGKATLDHIANALKAPTPSHLLPTAPAHGLTLERIFYETD